MRNRKQGFTLIELLIVIAIIGILAAVLIPNLLNARARSFDAAAQTCLKELSVQQEVVASNAPFNYSVIAPNPVWAFVGATPFGVTIGGTAVNACAGVQVVNVGVTNDTFSFTGRHERGLTTYQVQNGTGVRPI